MEAPLLIILSGAQGFLSHWGRGRVTGELCRDLSGSVPSLQNNVSLTCFNFRITVLKAPGQWPLSYCSIHVGAGSPVSDSTAETTVCKNGMWVGHLLLLFLFLSSLATTSADLKPLTKVPICSSRYERARSLCGNHTQKVFSTAT